MLALKSLATDYCACLKQYVLKIKHNDRLAPKHTVYSMVL